MKYWYLIAMAALLGGGCGGGQNAAQSTTVAASAAAIPTPTPRPTPTPTPDPQKIPTWAQGRVFHDIPMRPKEKIIALTFDDGPWPEYTRQILKVLRQNDIKATFFMVGSVVREYPQIAREVKAGGHAIGNHSWSHPSRPRNPVAEIQRTDAALKSVLGIQPTLFRPPYGLLKNGLARQAMKEKQAVLIWSADSNDWKRPGAARIARNVLNEATPGGIVLMHDGGGSRSGTVAALPIIIDTLRERGYSFVTVPELLERRYIKPPAKKATPTKKAISLKNKPVPDVARPDAARPDAAKKGTS